MTKPPVTTEDIVRALAQAFNVDEFDAFVESQTGQTLEEITDGRAAGFAQFVGAVRYIRRHGDVLSFVRSAAEKRPASTRLEAIAKQMSEEAGLRYDADLMAALLRTLAEGEVSAASLVAAYRMFAPGGSFYHLKESPGGDIARIIVERLANFIDPQRLLCVVLYLAWLHEGTNASTLLHAWVSDAMSKGFYDAKTKKDATDLVADTVEKHRKLRLHLLIALRRPDPGEANYTVKAWRQFVNAKGKADPMIVVGTPRQCPEGELERVVDDIIRSVERDREEIIALLQREAADPDVDYRMVVELFLPLHLLAQPADQWQLQVNQPVALGLRHWVVVRSWERTYDPDREYETARSNWRRFWSFRPSSNAIWCDLVQFASYPAHVERNEAWAVALRFVPQPPQWKDVITSGTPVALWIREHYHQSFEQFVNAILGRPHEWRKDVSTERRLPASPPHAQRLTLLWDEPDRDRLPPDAIDNVSLMPPRRG